jgi:hypothetical protein
VPEPTGVEQEGQFVLERRLPIDHVFVELGAVALFTRVLEFIKRLILGVEQTAVLGQEVVADRLMHVVLPTAARSLRAGTQDDTASVRWPRIVWFTSSFGLLMRPGVGT